MWSRVSRIRFANDNKPKGHQKLARDANFVTGTAWEGENSPIPNIPNLKDPIYILLMI